MKLFFIAAFISSILYSQSLDEEYLPVTMLYFEYEILDASILLKWGTATEIENYGFEVQRANVNWEWNVLGFVDGHGTTFNTHHYTFEDTTVEFAGTFYYRLKQLDNNGGFEYHDTLTVTFTSIAAENSLLPQHFFLSQNYPNPFNPFTKIKFSVPDLSFVSLKLYDAAGREVKILFEREFYPGNYSFLFDASGLSSGVYFYTLSSDEFSSSKKLLLLK